jgi:hypothetical protein
MYLNRIAGFALASAILLASCGGSQSNSQAAAETAAADAAKAAQVAAAAADEAVRKKSEADAASAAAAREAELALQHSELKSKEPAPRIVTVPSGTELKLTLASDLSTKSAKVGDTFRARLGNDVMAEGKVAIPAGTTVVGQVTNVVSGSDKIGAVPTISLHFNSLEYSGGKTLPISGDYTSTGKSEKGQDTAKIVGGAAAGAILGHQVNDKSSGTIIGGLLGAGAGTLAAKKTGTEVKLPADTPVIVVLGAPLKVQVN